jgi:hypothetical protein
MVTVRTRNSVYQVKNTQVMLVSGTPSKHLPFGEWVEVQITSTPTVGERLVINYLDGQTRYTSIVTSVEQPSNVKV